MLDHVARKKNQEKQYRALALEHGCSIVCAVNQGKTMNTELNKTNLLHISVQVNSELIYIGSFFCFESSSLPPPPKYVLISAFVLVELLYN